VKSYTLWSRLKNIIATPSGRKHLLKTWRFSTREAFRAASGMQVSEVLVELDKLSSTTSQTIDSSSKMITPTQFEELASKFSAGKLSGHSQVYSQLDLKPAKVSRVLEVGIGTNDESAASSMGKEGVPGASLRMWAELFPNAEVYGADVDPKSHISADRIQSVLLDSTDQESIQKFLEYFANMTDNSGFDLIIDDGLHTPESNLRLLNSLFPLVRQGGFYVIEDIPVAWKGFWSAIASSIHSAEWGLLDSLATGQGSHCFLLLKKRA